MSEVARIEPTKSDVTYAKEIRDQITPLLEQVCLVVNAARSNGLQVNFQIGLDQFGRQRIIDLSVLKVL